MRHVFYDLFPDGRWFRIHGGRSNCLTCWTRKQLDRAIRDIGGTGVYVKWVRDRKDKIGREYTYDAGPERRSGRLLDVRFERHA